MKILLLTHTSPFTESSGANQRTKFLYESLCNIGSVDVAIFDFFNECNSTNDNKNGKVAHIHLPSAGLRNRPSVPVRSGDYTRRLCDVFNLGEYEVIVSRYVRYAIKFNLPGASTVVVDYDDAYYTIPWGSTRTVKGLIRELATKFNDIGARWLVKCGAYKFDHCFFVNDRDRARYAGLSSTVLPNIPVRPKAAVDFRLTGSPAILFVGLMTYRPNIEAMDRFITECWETIVAAHPTTRLLIAGESAPHLKDRWARAKNCTVLGFVEHLGDAYRQATFSIAPIWSGGGSNIKVLESYMYGRAVVASNYSYEGLNSVLRQHQDILTADCFASFGARCIDLLAEPGRATEMARSGHAAIDSSLSFDVFRQRVEAGVGQALRKVAPNAPAQ